MSIPFVSLGNIITLSTISSQDTYAYYELPIESEVVIEQEVIALVERE